VNGTKIRVIKAGKIIPKVIGVVDGKGKPDVPTECPVCSSKLERVEAGTDENPTLELFCRNSDCPAKQYSRLEHYLATIGVLGIGGSRVEQLASKGAVKTFADFYSLTLDEIQACGLSERQSLLILAAVHMVPNPEAEKDNDKLVKKISNACKRKRRIPAWKVFAALGIPTAGKSAGKALIAHFGSFDTIRNASIEEMTDVEDVGEKTAETVVQYLGENSAMLDELLQFVEPEAPKIGKLTGKTFCLSGSFAEGKKHWETQIEELGGKCSGSVGSKTDYLVAGPGSGAKSDKAKSLGVEIIGVEGLKKLL
jgi:DNA ligase (NAD+)